ncbi:MAG: hypothetical protein Q7S52_05560 [bacterium]|nr:hypothetical protein [bacterium]
MKTKTARVLLPSSGQVTDMQCATLQGVAEASKFMTGEGAQLIVGKKGEFKNEIKKFLLERQHEAQIADWEKFYQEVLGWRLDFPHKNHGGILPTQRPGFAWPIFEVSGLNFCHLIASCRKLFPVDCYDEDLDTRVGVGLNKRLRTSSHFVVWAHADPEPFDYHDSSAVRFSPKFSAITLRQQLLLSLWYFWKTGIHMHQQVMSYCAGSLDTTTGSIPAVWACDETHTELMILEAERDERSLNDGCVREVIQYPEKLIYSPPLDDGY